MRGLLYSLLVILLFSDVVSAQQRYSVAGKVLSNNEPLIGASVVLKEIADTTHITGVVTDTLGSFRLNTSPGMYILEISYIGYNTLRSNVNVKGDVNLPSVSLSAESEQLKELVVTANTVTFNSNGYVAEISKNPLYKKNTLNNILLATPVHQLHLKASLMLMARVFQRYILTTESLNYVEMRYIIISRHWKAAISSI